MIACLSLFFLAARGCCLVGAFSSSMDMNLKSKIFSHPSLYWSAKQREEEVPPVYLQSIRAEPWRGMLEPVEDQELAEVQVVEGSIPKGLKGTLFRNGPTLRSGMHVHGHWFDGDGAIMKCVFAADGRVYSQLRNVDTPARRSLQAGLGANGLRRAWTNRKGGVFGNLLRPPANVANTSVLRLPTVLLALWEGGPPTPLDPITLETLPGHWDFGGDRSSAFTAHPTRTPSGDLFGYGSSPQGFDIMRLAPDGSRILKSHGQALSDVTHSHDFAVTDRHIIVLGSDRIRRAGALRAVAGLCSFGDIFEFDQEKPSVAYFYSRASLELVSQIEVPSTSYYHLANAWHDDATDHTVLLVAKHKEGRRSELEGVFRNMYSRRLHDDLECELWRYEFDVKNAKLCARELAAPSDSACGFELPTVDPRVIGKPTRYVYVTSLLHDGGITNGIQKVDLQAHTHGEDGWTTAYFGPERFACEPVFVPKSPTSEEGDGWLLTFIYDSNTHTSDMYVLEASDLSTVAVAKLPYHIHYTFHGDFSETVDM